MARGKGHSKSKYEEDILQEVGLFLRRGLSDSRLQFVTITKVELNDDYSVAKLYWDTFEKQHKGEAKEAFRGVKGRIRNHLAKTLKVRHIPQIELVYDSQYEAEQEIIELLKK